MVNKLVDSNSPYLLQHAENPVDWYPWGGEALSKAKQENKPIFLSIGYAACHWCHVMAHESFEDEEIAAIMNENFINIKVDREERPDIDQIYMNAVVAMTGQGGWPLSAFLTPEGKPFYGGTYFPPTPRYNMPSFRNVLTSISKSWQEDRERIYQIGDQLTERLDHQSLLQTTEKTLKPDTLTNASMALAQSYDWKHGGWGNAPKFPQPMVIEYLLNRGVTGDKFALEIAIHALDRMAKGGMYDLVGGGFARYSTDNDWLVPHFEKMLYDNAQLSKVYLYAYLITGEERYRKVVEETLEFVSREMTHPEGGFYSSLDADTEGEEGKFYTWTLSQVRDALDRQADIELVSRAFGIHEGGNFEGSNVLQWQVDRETLADEFALPSDEIEARLNAIRKRLFEVRSQRVKPGVDDKVLVSWNALMCLSFSESGRYLGVDAYVDMAIRNLEFILKDLYHEGRLRRSWRKGLAQHNAYLEDYAGLILALLSLYQTTHQSKWYATAEDLAQEMVEHFRDPQGGFYDTRDDHDTLITRPKELQDNAVPSGNALATTALLQLSTYNGRTEWRDLAEGMLASVQDVVSRHPLGFGKWLCAMDFAMSPIKEVAILGDLEEERTQELVNTLWSQYRPHILAAISPYPPDPQSPPLLDNRPLLDGLPTAYVCQNFTCKQPVNEPEELLEQLSPNHPPKVLTN